MNIYKISDIVRDAIRDNNLIHNLPEGYCNFMSISAGELIGGQIMVMVFNVENTPAFSSYSIGSAVSAFPAGMSFGRGCLVDPMGNIVTNPNELIDELSGYSHGWSGLLDQLLKGAGQKVIGGACCRCGTQKINRAIL